MSATTRPLGHDTGATATQGDSSGRHPVGSAGDASSAPTPPVTPTEAVRRARAVFASGVTRPVDWRLARLAEMRRLLTEQEDVLCAALHDDLRKSRTEAMVTEVGFLVREVDHTRRHLAGWLRPRRVPVPLTLGGGRASVVPEPLGVVTVIAPWNYPVQLCLSPVLGALAAGNTVVLKPSELAPATSRALATLLPRYVGEGAVQVVEGGVAETTELLSRRVDHVFYTGNGTVGRVVLEAAARHLTPVTLELGGKSPAYVDPSADLAVTARRLVWGKFTNAGQTCIAPDYVLATPAVLDRLTPLLARAVEDFFGDDPRRSDDFGRIVSDRHVQRLAGLLEGQRCVTGGGVDAAERYVAPTVLADVDPASAVMAEEIFGPVLPLVAVPDLDAAIAFVVERDKPLALYVFADDPLVERRFERETSSGALAVNMPLAHVAVPDLPFGGVGASGTGSYHGRASVELFSHHKPVLRQRTRPDTAALLYPPSRSLRARLASRLMGLGR
jgi:aldehyde dehydrogenase (NAD+)